MLRINYTDENLNAIADAKAEQAADTIIATYKRFGGDYVHNVSSMVVIHWIRVAIAKGLVNCDEVEFSHNGGKPFKVSKTGRFLKSNSFPNYTGQALKELVKTYWW